MNLQLKISILKSGQPQWAVAQATGIGPVRLSQLVRAPVRPRPDEALRLAQVLGGSVDALFPETNREAVTA